MYSKPYVIVGIIIFLVLMATPLWINASGKGFEDITAELAKPKGPNCMEDAKWMIANHMELLNTLRELAVRYGERIYHSKTITHGKTTFNVSLTECWKCHDYENFCAKCHEFSEVRPVCWECHYNPSLSKPTVNAYNISEVMMYAR